MYISEFVIHLMAYISAWNTVVLSPKLKLCSRLKPHLYTPAPDEALFDVKFNSVLLLHLSGYLSVSGLWYAYLGII